MKNKKILLAMLIISLFNMTVSSIFNVCTVSAYSAYSDYSAQPKLDESKNYSWYFKPVTDNKQPDFDINLEEIKNYGAYTLGNKDEKVIYLTFDFGFENGNVKKCLDVLNKNNVKGAFFILENVIKVNSDLIKEIAETGHIIANHTMKHKNMCEIKNFADYEKEIIGLEKLCEEKIGCKMSKYFRPPKGEFTKQNLEYNKKLGYKTIFWSLAYKDWDNDNQPDAAETIQKLLKRTHNGAVVLLHPTSNTNAAILDALIKEWKKSGYRFGTLDELTAD